MIDKEELLNSKDFYKSFKNGEDLTSFFKQMHKRAVEHMLEAELDANIDNEKHEKTKEGNYRNGHGTKKIKSSFGESEIKVPRDREGRFRREMGKQISVRNTVLEKQLGRADRVF